MKRAMRICFDTNVVLDVMLAREPFLRPAALLFDAIVAQQISGLLVATTLTTVDYVVARAHDRGTSREGIRRLLERFEVAPVTGEVVQQALDLAFGDFEDAVLHEAARLARAEGIVTRNAVDFQAATLPVYTPEALLVALR